MVRKIRWQVCAVLIGGLATLGASVAPANTTPVIVNEAQIALNGGVTVHLKAVPFDAQQHAISPCTHLGTRGDVPFCKVWDVDCVCYIDGQEAFGANGKLPASQLIQASLVLGDDRIDLDVSGMFNPWITGPRPQDFTLMKNAGGYLLHGEFSGGNESYEAEWQVTNDSAVRTRLVRKGC